MATFNVPTIGSLQKVQPAPGDDAIVSGYTAPGDLGGGTFYWEGTAPASATVAGTAAVNATVSAASNATPIEITTSAPHTYATGQVVLIDGVGGNTNANGTWIITVNNNTAFTLNGSSGNGGYTSGGTVFTTTITTSEEHRLATNQQAMIAGVGGMTNVNGRWRLTVLSPKTFSIAAQLNAASGGGAVGDGGTSVPSEVTTGRWRRIYSGPLNVRWFGATGNGSTDDTTPIQGALTTLGLGYETDSPSGVVFGGGRVFIPPGTYKIIAPLIVPAGSTNSNIVIEGAGQDNTVLKAFGSYFFPVIQSLWPINQTIRTFLSVRDVAITSNFSIDSLSSWSANTAYAKGTVITSGLSNRLLLCTTTGTSGARRPFGQLWSGVISDPVISITGTPSVSCLQVIIRIDAGGALGTATFVWSTDGYQTLNGPGTTASSVALGSTGLTARFSSGTYVADRFYCSPPMGYGFSTVHDTTLTDNTVQWTVIDGGCGILQFNGGEICIERVHFVAVVVGVIFDGTEVSVVRDCTFDCPNGIWLTGANQRLNNPAVDSDNSLGQANVNSIEDCWFDCGQLSFASEGNLNISLSNCNFEAGQWYGWTTGVTLLKVSNMGSEGGHNGWFVGSLAPFNGTASFSTTNATFENCLINPKKGTGPAVQASNYAPATSGFLALGTPFQRLSFKGCYLASTGSAVFVGMGVGNGYRVVDTVWGGKFTGATAFDASSLATLSEYSDGASSATAGGSIIGYGCVPKVGLDVNRSFALRAVSTTVSPDPGNGTVNDFTNPLRASVEVTSSGGVPWSLTGVTGGTEGQILEIVNLTGQTMHLPHQNTLSSSGNRLLCPSAATISLPTTAGGFSWVRLKYSALQSAWLVLDHS